MPGADGLVGCCGPVAPGFGGGVGAGHVSSSLGVAAVVVDAAGAEMTALNVYVGVNGERRAVVCVTRRRYSAWGPRWGRRLGDVDHQELLLHDLGGVLSPWS